MTLLAQAETTLNLTNDVPITDDGMRLIITDQTDMNEVTIKQPKELKAEDDVFWVFHNTSTNKHGTLWLGMMNSFAVELTTTNGLPIAKTDKAKVMGAAPKSPTDPRASHARVIGPPPALSA